MLSEDAIRRIRLRVANGDKQSAIALDEGISPSYVSQIVNGNRRRSVRRSEFLTFADIGRKELRCCSCGHVFGVTKSLWKYCLNHNWRCPHCKGPGWVER